MKYYRKQNEDTEVAEHLGNCSRTSQSAQKPCLHQDWRNQVFSLEPVTAKGRSHILKAFLSSPHIKDKTVLSSLKSSIIIP